MSRYEVGEVAILAGSDWPQYPVGMEVTILEARELPSGSTCYLIDKKALPNGDWWLMWAWPESLRKKRPPSTDWWRLCKLDEVPEPEKEIA